MRVDRLSGQLDLLLLEVLRGAPAHGYGVIVALREQSDGALALTEGSVYPALHRLEKNGLIISRWEPVGGRRRRIYAVTEDGLRSLEAERRAWRALAAAVDAIMRPAAAVTP